MVSADDETVRNTAILGSGALILFFLASRERGDGGNGDNGDPDPDPDPDELPAGDSPPSDALVGQDAPQASSGDNYIWVRSADGGEVSFALEAEGGNVAVDTDATGMVYWATPDGSVGGGVNSVTETGVPGFFFDGDITRWRYGGSPEVYINDFPVDPDSVVEHFEDGNGGGDPIGNYPDGVPSSWETHVLDHFEGGALDDSIWSYGFGWGDNAAYTHGTAVPEAVSVSDSMLRFEPICYGWQDYGFGAVNTQDKVTIEPPVFTEASIRAADMPGMNTAFWTKPNNENWPPEIDILEVPSRADMSRSIHHIHFDREMRCSSSSDVGNKAQTGNGPHYYDRNQAQDFHRHGILWMDDSITHYVDGQPIGTTSGGEAIDHQSACGPHYVMLNALVSHRSWGSVGMPPACTDWDDWKSSVEVDWFRVVAP